MSEPELVVENREHLWNLLIQAAQLEHLIMCQYLYACFSLKTDPDEGLPGGGQMARDADRHRGRGDAAPRSGRQRHDGDRRRAVPFPAELPAPLGVPAA